MRVKQTVENKPSEDEFADLVNEFIDTYCQGDEENASRKVTFLLTWLSKKLPKLDVVKDHDYIMQLYDIYKILCARFGRVMNQSGFRLFTGISKAQIDRLIRRQTYESIPRINEILEFWGEILKGQSVDALLDDMTQAHKGGMTQMFIAKAVYGLNDNLAPEPSYLVNESVPVEQLPDLSVGNLPRLGRSDKE